MKVYHFHNGTGGGVLSVIKNLLRFSKNRNIENHIIHAVNKAIIPDYIIEPIEGAISQQLYYYSPSNNFYHTCKQLAKLLPDHEAIIVAHDWVELGMVSNLGLQNRVVHVLHGDFDYYYELAEINSCAIDAYICISPKIFGTLRRRLSHREDSIFYLRFPVPPIEKIDMSNDQLHLIYYVRNLKDNRKQFSTILEIAGLLGDIAADDYYFTIAGGGMTVPQFFEVWPNKMKHNVGYKGYQTTKEILDILPGNDIFLLPSLAEGLPVSLVESMKAGVVPLVTNWNGAVNELIIPEVTGYYFDIGAAADYVTCIRNLKADSQLLKKLAKNCVQIANTLFEPVNNTKEFEQLFEDVATNKIKKKKPFKVYGSRLDQSWLGNTLTYTFRSKFKKG